MPWWALTFLENSRAYTTLFTHAVTNLADHLFMAWATHKPSRARVYRTIRGTLKFCGYKYTWNTPHIVEQNQNADTLHHTFGEFPVQATNHVWYYLFSIAGPYDQPCQGPLIHVLPWTTTMPSCRLTNSVLIPVPLPLWTDLPFDTARWDDGGFHLPGPPSALQAPTPGLYEIGAGVTFDTTVATGLGIRLRFNAGLYIASHVHSVGPNGWEGTGLSLHTLWPFDAGDLVQVQVYQFNDPAAVIIKESLYSPEFWINYIGPNPT